MIKPVGKNLLVRRVESDNVTAVCIHIPDTAKKTSMRGVVVKVPHEDSEDDPPADPGQTVIFRKYAGTDVRVGDEDLLFLTFEDVLGVES